MTIVQAILLGIVQGLTEFLPVSSSGHLILVPYLFDWDPQGLTFDLALHVGTLLAAAIYFVRDWMAMVRSAIRDARAGRWREMSRDTRLLLLLALGSVPAAITGAFLNDVESNLRKPLVVAVMLVLVAGIMWLAERSSTQHRALHDLTPRNALLTGLAQAIALVPGTSRSGITISAGLSQGFDREIATRFSFLLATPITFGAVLYNFSKAAGDRGETFRWAPFVAGAVASAAVGMLAIHFLLRYLRFNTLRVFIWYRIALAAAVLIVAVAR